MRIARDLLAPEVMRDRQPTEEERLVGRRLIAEMEATGQSGGGLVTVTLTGKFEMKSLKVDPSLFKEDEVEILEDLILAAHNDAKAKVETAMKDKTSALTAGLPLPPGFKLPF